MRTFFDEILKYNWDEVRESIYAKHAADVEEALGKEKRTLEDFKALISPAASDYLEPMAKLSHQITQKRFGKTIQLYLPLYLSNECTNFCVYCGFNHDNDINRLTLNEEMVMKEVEAIKDMGYTLLFSDSLKIRKELGFAVITPVRRIAHIVGIVHLLALDDLIADIHILGQSYSPICLFFWIGR